MPDFAPNYTARLRLAYSVQSRSHHMTWRLPAATVPADLSDAADKVVAFLDALSTRIYGDFSVLNWAYQLADTAIFLPYSGPAWADASLSTAGRPDSAAAMALSFVGRSNAGQRAAFFLYGFGTDPVTDADAVDFRIHSGEDSAISTAIAVLNDTPPPLVANDNNDVIWYEYANTKYNDYWVGRSR